MSQHSPCEHSKTVVALSEVVLMARAFASPFASATYLARSCFRVVEEVVFLLPVIALALEDIVEEVVVLLLVIALALEDVAEEAVNLLPAIALAIAIVLEDVAEEAVNLLPN